MDNSFTFSRGLIYLLLLLVAGYYLLPLFVMIITSLKDLDEIRNGTIFSLPQSLNFDAWEKAWGTACTGASCDGLKGYFWNSVLIAVPAILISTILGAINGYVLTKWKFRGSNLFFGLLLIGTMIPFQVILLPMAQTLGYLGLSGSIPGLILVHIIYGLAFTTLFFRNYYITIPNELVNAARIDGAGFWKIFMRIILPVSTPIVVVSLQNINLEIEPGQFLILVGPSGCGKSTLLNMIAGLESVTSGDILIGDKNVTHLNPKDRDIAMVFQSYALYPNMTIRKNISFSMEMRKVSKEIQDETVNRVAKMLQIEQLLDRKPAQLSGGQRQRVAMGRALARDPSLFLFDEPLSNLDAKLRVEMRAEIKQLHQRTKTSIVYVTHDQIEAMTLGDVIAVMKDGVIQQFGTPKDIYDDH